MSDLNDLVRRFDVADAALTAIAEWNAGDGKVSLGETVTKAVRRVPSVDANEGERVRREAVRLVRAHAARLGMDSMAAELLAQAIEKIA